MACDYELPLFKGKCKRLSSHSLKRYILHAIVVTNPKVFGGRKIFSRQNCSFPNMPMNFLNLLFNVWTFLPHVKCTTTILFCLTGKIYVQQELFLSSECKCFHLTFCLIFAQELWLPMKDLTLPYVKWRNVLWFLKFCLNTTFRFAQKSAIRKFVGRQLPFQGSKSFGSAAWPWKANEGTNVHYNCTNCTLTPRDRLVTENAQTTGVCNNAKA